MKGHIKCLYVLIALLFGCLLYLVQSKHGIVKIVDLTQDSRSVNNQNKEHVVDRPPKRANPQKKFDWLDLDFMKPRKDEEVNQQINKPVSAAPRNRLNQNDQTYDQTAEPAQIVGSDGLHPDVKIVPSTPEPGLRLPYRDCLPLPESPKEGVQICIHPRTNDRGVSGTLKRGILWEGNLIHLMDGRLKDDPSLVFFDIGCNIGEYALWAAALGREVIAVEMLMSNVHMIQTSLSLSGLTDKVTIVNNALYKDHRVLETHFIQGTIGASRLNTTKTFGTENKRMQTTYVNTVCIDDLIPLMKGRNVYIKMDIENSEHTALECAHKFFQEVNVKVVQMEWHRRVPEESIPILKFMKKYGYVVSYKPMPYRPVDFDKDRRMIDVFFLKKSQFDIE